MVLRFLNPCLYEKIRSGNFFMVGICETSKFSIRMAINIIEIDDDFTFEGDFLYLGKAEEQYYVMDDPTEPHLHELGVDCGLFRRLEIDPQKTYAIKKKRYEVSMINHPSYRFKRGCIYRILMGESTHNGIFCWKVRAYRPLQFSHPTSRYPSDHRPMFSLIGLKYEELASQLHQPL